MKTATSITTTAKTKSSFKARTKIVAMVLSIITAFSVLTVSVGSVSAAGTEAAASTSSATNSIDGGALISGLTTSVVGKAIDLGTRSNPVTAILGAGVSSVFDSLFGSIFSHEDKTQEKILRSVKEISEELKSNHDEEMLALNNIELMIKTYQQEIKQTTEAYGETIIDELQMLNFNYSCRDLTNLYYSVFDQIYYNCKDLPYSDGEVQLIDEDTYTAYSKILTKVGFDSNIDIEVKFNDIYRFLDANQDNFYQLMIDKYKKAIERKGLMSFESMSDFHEIQASIDQIESDVVMYYIAYTSLLQMDYQCDNYRHNLSLSKYDELSMNSAIAEINDAAKKMTKINDAYASACELIDSLTTACVTKGSTTKYFTNSPLAWAVSAAEQSNSGTSITFRLLKDWSVSLDDTCKMINKDQLENYGFNADNGTPELDIYGNMHIELIEASFDGSLMDLKMHDGSSLTINIGSDSPYHAGHIDWLSVDKSGSSATVLDWYDYIDSSDGSRRLEYYLRHWSHGLV